MKTESRVTKITVTPEGNPVFCEMATHIEIVDEAAGEFVEVKQDRDKDSGCIKIDVVEWPAIRAAINRLIKSCREYP